MHTHLYLHLYVCVCVRQQLTRDMCRPYEHKPQKDFRQPASAPTPLALYRSSKMWKPKELLSCSALSSVPALTRMANRLCRLLVYFCVCECVCVRCVFFTVLCSHFRRSSLISRAHRRIIPTKQRDPADSLQFAQPSEPTTSPPLLRPLRHHSVSCEVFG